MAQLNSKSSHEYKILLLGDVGVGKTSTMRRFVSATFKENYKPTLGAEILIKEVTFDNKTILLQIWDLAGAYNFKNIRPNFYKKTDGAFLICDLTRADTLNDLENWKGEVNKSIHYDPIYLIIGNKSDLGNVRIITKDMLNETQKQLRSLGFIETSAKTGENVEKAFEMLIKALIQ